MAGDTGNGSLVVVLTWLGVSLVSSIPFLMYGSTHYSTAWVESVSALTTTGIEFVGSIQEWPKALLWYRQQLEWIGGAGIIILMLSLLALHEGALLSVYYGEYGSDVRDVRVTPRLKSTARSVCFIYGVFWSACSLCYMLGGVPLYYAMLEAMATVSTGGFSVIGMVGEVTATQQWVAIVFMLLGAVGFHVHYQVLYRWVKQAYFRCSEVRGLLLLVGIGYMFCALLSANESIARTVFDVVAFATTTGFETELHLSSPFLALFFMVLGLVGGAAGSTAGGIKIVRFYVLMQEAKFFLLRCIQPNIVKTVFVDGRALSGTYVSSIRGYIFLFLCTMLLGLFFLVSTGMPIDLAFGWLCATVTNVGASTQALSPGDLTGIQKLGVSCIMLLGRVEMAVFLVLFMPQFWQIK
nr:potassium transporter TrkG [Candidatus Synchoanobacter obligatus]